MAVDLDSLAAAVGLSRSVLIFLISFFASVPLSYLHRAIPSTTGRHLYAFLSGALLCWTSYGGFHANLRLYAPILFAYGAMLASRRLCGYIVFAGSFAFLAYCHVSNLSGDRWRQGGMDYTGTLMILTLKVTSCAMDFQDGWGPQEKGSHRMYANRIQRCPTLLEFLGYTFCCGSILVGPVFEFKGYQAYVERRGVWDPKAERPEPSPLLPAVQRLGQAALCLLVYQTLNARFPGAFMADPKFLVLPLAKRWGYVVLAGFTFRWMYYFIWSVAETAMVLSGLGFSGWSTTHPDKPQWLRAQNMALLRVELGWSAAQLPSYWNMSVAKWMRCYVYDRLTPPSGRPGLWTLIATQSLSALWHGLYPGYFLFFVNCACAQHASKALYKLYSSLPEKNAMARGAAILAQFLFAHSIANYSEIGFLLLRGDHTLRVWQSVFFLGTICPLLVSLIVPPLTRRQRRAEKKE